MIERALSIDSRMQVDVPDFRSPHAVCACGARASTRMGVDGANRWYCPTHTPAGRRASVAPRSSLNLRAASLPTSLNLRSTFAQPLVHRPMLGESVGFCPCGDRSTTRYQAGRTEFLFCARHAPSTKHVDVAQLTRTLVSERLARLTACPCGKPGTEQRFADVRRVPFWFCRAHVPDAGVDVRMHSSSLVRQRLEQLIRRRR